MKIATISEKKNNWVMYFFLQCKGSSYPVKSQRKHFIVYVYFLKFDYGTWHE